MFGQWICRGSRHHSKASPGVLKMRVLGFAFAAMLAVGFAPGAGSAQTSDDPFVQLTAQLAESLSDRISCSWFSGSDIKAAGIWPFDEQRIPIGANSARRIYGDLLAQLTTSTPDCIQYIDGAGVRAVLNRMHHLGAFQSGRQSVQDVVGKIRDDLDVVVEPILIQQGAKAYLSLKAIETSSARLLGQTASMAIPNIYLNNDASDSALVLDVALKQASRYLFDGAAGLRDIRPGGVLYKSTGSQPEFGFYVLEKVQSEITRLFQNQITDKQLSVRQFVSSHSGRRGAEIVRRDLDPMKDADDNQFGPDSYELSGRYWVFETTIELRLSLRNAENKTVTWHGKISRNSLPDIELEPISQALDVHEVRDPSAVLTITSPRGDNPVYKPGEELIVHVHVDRPSWLYCFYIDANGSVVQLLPNYVQEGGAGGRFFAADILHKLPDETRDPFLYRITGSPLGEEIFKCFSSTRDVTAELPNELQGKMEGTVPVSLATRLGDIFRQLADTTIGEASLTITVR